MIRPRMRDNTLLRFLVVGASLAGLYAVLAALATSQLPLPKAVAAALAWITTIPVGFWAHRRFTFVASRPRRHALWFYAATQALGIGIAAGIGHLFARGSFWPDLPVHLSASLLSAAVSYLINSTLVFRGSSAD